MCYEYWSQAPTSVWVGYGYVTSGGLVRAVQEMVDYAGFSVGPNGFDGQYGPDTENAIKEWQTANGLSADGIVGSQTWNSFENYLHAGNSDSEMQQYSWYYNGSSPLLFEYWFNAGTNTNAGEWSYPNENSLDSCQYWMDDQENPVSPGCV
uniref:peptidoglycan-binding domain-containing protein n=1 Tax=Alicyclobacillus tolerans TaxID=90970 RepID=UPI00235113AA|nr:peptidoglycan-binding domain-containing protein [Alicyclobacillus tolerans]